MTDTIKIKVDENENVIGINAVEEEEKYFIKIEITKDKYDEIKQKIKQAQGE